MNYAWYDIPGNIGVALLIAAYWMLQSGRLHAGQPLYSVLNGLGAAFILFSLFFDFNLSAAIIEVFWLAISFYGLLRSLRGKVPTREDSQ
ncbi:MAG: hypothetical protein KDI06_02665 [Calditrichaeota bacterium]|nr:hypothetical protein [Calditrichota bacterium]HQU74404.1 hypothetical protein [Calditrichia bacterium]